MSTAATVPSQLTAGERRALIAYWQKQRAEVVSELRELEREIARVVGKRSRRVPARMDAAPLPDAIAPEAAAAPPGEEAVPRPPAVSRRQPPTEAAPHEAKPRFKRFAAGDEDDAGPMPINGMRHQASEPRPVLAGGGVG